MTDHLSGPRHRIANGHTTQNNANAPNAHAPATIATCRSATASKTTVVTPASATPSSSSPPIGAPMRRGYQNLEAVATEQHPVHPDRGGE